MIPSPINEDKYFISVPGMLYYTEGNRIKCKKKLQIRNSIVDFLAFAKDAPEEGD